MSETDTILLFCFQGCLHCAVLFLILLVEGLDVNEYLAQFLGLFIYGAANFIANKKITFNKKGYNTEIHKSCYSGFSLVDLLYYFYR